MSWPENDRRRDDQRDGNKPPRHPNHRHQRERTPLPPPEAAVVARPRKAVALNTTGNPKLDQLRDQLQELSDQAVTADDQARSFCYSLILGVIQYLAKERGLPHRQGQCESLTEQLQRLTNLVSSADPSEQLLDPQLLWDELARDPCGPQIWTMFRVMRQQTAVIKAPPHVRTKLRIKIDKLEYSYKGLPTKDQAQKHARAYDQLFQAFKTA